MNRDLVELINYYEKEQSNLKELIKECLEFYDYKFAYEFQNALGFVGNQLNILYKLSDPNYSKKKNLEDNIEFYNKLNIDMPEMAEYYSFKINQAKAIIGSLSKQHAETFYDGQEFDDAIFDLIEQKIKSITFHLKKSSNLYLKFSVKNNYLRIKLTPFLELKDNCTLARYDVKKLKVIGFRKNRSKKYLRYKYDLSGFKDTIEIKQIVSRVIYDVFFYHELHKMTTLEIKA